MGLKYYVVGMMVGLGCIAQAAEPVRVAVIDTGLDLRDERFREVLCKGPVHVDLTGKGIHDYAGHGTHVAGLIKQYAGKSNYCLIIIKMLKGYGYERADETAAILFAVSRGATFINISANGRNKNSEEEEVIRRNPGVTVVAAAGNEGENIEDYPEYPASYQLSNVISVGALGRNGVPQRHSNFGTTIKAWEVGEDVPSTDIGGTTSFKTGTSMATAIHTGKLVYEATH